jgi:hypothetical protein
MNIKKKNKFKSKPSYDLYIQLWYTLDTYLMTRINDYIFFEYYKWNIPESILMQPVQMDINILKKIMEYDYEVFKVILYLYWDLEYYMEGIDGVKNSLIVDSTDYIFLIIKFSNELKEWDAALKTYIEQINNKNSSYFWAEIEIYGLLDKILKYDLFFNFEPMNQNKNYIEEYNKFNDKIGNDEIATLKVRLYRFNTDKKIDSLYYESYINKWYKEWFLKLNEKKTSKYKKKIKKLNLMLKLFMKLFKEDIV